MNNAGPTHLRRQFEANNRHNWKPTLEIEEGIFKTIFGKSQE